MKRKRQGKRTLRDGREKKNELIEDKEEILSRFCRVVDPSVGRRGDPIYTEQVRGNYYMTRVERAA